ncbi:MAG: methylmalonyl-CoA epimerase [Gemmatimonadota bacterium]
METPSPHPTAGRRLHHVGVAVPSIRDVLPLYERMAGTPGSPIETVESQKVRVCFVGLVELLEPTDPSSTVARFLDRRGPGLHHLAFAVDDLAEELDRLAGEGVRLIDRVPRPGAFGHRVAFLHPESTGRVLTELVEAAG